MNETTGQMRQNAGPCPECGHQGSLIGLGERTDAPYFWPRWATPRTHIFACSRCDAIVAAREERKGRVVGLSRWRGHHAMG